jgi:MFS family permease
MKKRIYPVLIVICCCGMAIVALGLTVNCAGVFYAPMAETLGVGIGDVSLYLTVMCISAAIFSPYAVSLARKVRLQILIAGGCALACLGFLGLSWTKSIWQLYLWAALIGLSVAPLGMAMITSVIGNWFSKAMGLAIGMAMSFSGVVGAVMSPVFSRLIELYGWKNAFRIEAAITFVALLPAMLFIRMQPGELCMEPYGAATEQEAQRKSAAKTEERTGSSMGRCFVLLCIITVMGSFIAGFGSHLSQYARSVGLATMTGAYMISAAMVGNMFSKLILGVLCDLIGSKRACLIVFALSLTGLLGLFFLPAQADILLLAAALLLGSSYASAGVGASNMSRQLFGERYFGKYYAYISSVGIVSSAFSYSLIGYSYDLTGKYTLAILSCVGMAVISICCIFAAFRKTE